MENCTTKRKLAVISKSNIFTSNTPNRSQITMGDSPQGKNTNENIDRHLWMNKNNIEMSSNYENNKDTNDTVISDNETVVTKNTV